MSDKQKSQSDILGEANKILEELNKMAEDPEAYKQNVNKNQKTKDDKENR